MKRRAYVKCALIALTLVLALGQFIIFPYLREQVPGNRLGALPIRDVTPFFKSGFPNHYEIEPYLYNRNKLFQWPRVLYTQNGGFIDIDHVRNSADMTFYFYKKIQKSYLGGVADIRLSLGPFTYHIVAHQAKMSAGEMIDAAQYLAYHHNVWSEIATWYGYSTIPCISERPSAFSYDDIYSDLVGASAAADALREATTAPPEQFSHLAQRNLNRMIGLLQPVAGQEALGIVKQLDGKWWASQIRWPDNNKILRRNTDIGLENKSVTPWLADAKQKYGQPLSVPQQPNMLELRLAANFSTAAWDRMLQVAGLHGTKVFNSSGDLSKIMKALENDIHAELGDASTKP